MIIIRTASIEKEAKKKQKGYCYYLLRRGHFYFAQKRTFLLCVDKGKRVRYLGVGGYRTLRGLGQGKVKKELLFNFF